MDAGWHRLTANNKEILYKGYCDNEQMHTVATEFSTNPIPRYHGNFAVIVVDENSLTLSHDLNRSFPLNVDEDGFLTNITKNNSSVAVWADRFAIYNGTDLEFEYFDPYCQLDLDFETKLSLSECVEKISDILEEKLNFIKKVGIPKKIFLTGGMDTTLLYAISKTNTNDCEIITYEHIDYNNFLLTNYHSIKNEYAVYNQMQCWNNPTLLFCGAPGDEYFMRGPYISGLWAAWHNIDLLKNLENNNYYHKKHFFKKTVAAGIAESFKNKSTINDQYATYTDLCRQILNICANDHQMWHLNNTLTWTPFKDLRILSTVLKLESTELLEQILDAKLSKQLIAKYDPTAINILSDFKNYNNYANFLKIKEFNEMFNTNNKEPQ